MTWTVLARRPDGSIAGALRAWKLSLTLRFNAVGSWRLAMPRELCPAGWPAPGCGIVVVSDGQVRASGMVDEEAFDWEADPDSEYAGPGMWALTGDTDLARIGYRIFYPNPASPWAAQTVSSHYTASGNAETLMRNLVDVQAGPGALAARAVPGLVLGALAGVGVNTSVRERFTLLLDVLRSVALAGGGLGFDVVDDRGGSMRFVVYQPADRTRTCRFSRELGNLTGLHAATLSPAATVALVAGSGQLTDRKTLEVADPAANPAWGRREVFVDQRQTSDPVEYLKAAVEELDRNGEQARVSATLRDTKATRWGRDWNLGDRVAIASPLGEVSDVVREVLIDVAEIGDPEVSSTVGTSQASTDDQMARLVRQLLRRISYLERSV